MEVTADEVLGRSVRPSRRRSPSCSSAEGSTRNTTTGSMPSTDPDGSLDTNPAAWPLDRARSGATWRPAASPATLAPAATTTSSPRTPTRRARRNKPRRLHRGSHGITSGVPAKYTKTGKGRIATARVGIVLRGVNTPLIPAIRQIPPPPPIIPDPGRLISSASPRMTVAQGHARKPPGQGALQCLHPLHRDPAGPRRSTSSTVRTRCRSRNTRRKARIGTKPPDKEGQHQPRQGGDIDRHGEFGPAQHQQREGNLDPRHEGQRDQQRVDHEDRRAGSAARRVPGEIWQGWPMTAPASMATCDRGRSRPGRAALPAAAAAPRARMVGGHRVGAACHRPFGQSSHDEIG